MATVLIVDDSEQKVSRIRRVIDDALLVSRAHVLEAGNLSDAANIVSRQRVDLLVLDVRVPMRRGEEAREDGGVEFLRQLSTGRIPGKPVNIVGLTAFADLAGKYRDEFTKEAWVLIDYDDTSDVWADALTRKIVHVAAIEASQGRSFGRDLAIVTALRPVELEAVLKLPCRWSREHVEGDATEYFSGAIEFSGSSLSVIACAASQMGMPASTALASKLIEVFRPRYLAMVGIAAGVKGNFGDILIADQAWDYGSGKRIVAAGGAQEFQPAPFALPLDEGVRVKLESFIQDDRVLRGIRADWDGEDPGTPLRAVLGPIASGAAVLADPLAMKAIQAQNRKVVGVEMEAYSVFVSARCCRVPQPVALAIKSICDKGDEQKDDRFQKYAAYTSARFLFEFAKMNLRG